MEQKRNDGRSQGQWRRRRACAVSGLFVACVCLFLVTGCGFKLRGTVADARQLPAVYLHTERGSRRAVELYAAFHQAGIELVEQRDQAGWLLSLSDEQRDKRVLSVDSSGKVQEYELHYAVNYTLHDSEGRVIIDTQLLSLVRDYSFSGVDVLAKADEEELLYQGMQQQAAQMIMWRLLSQGENSKHDKAAANGMGGAAEQP